jgi:hypothetical protein
VLAAERDAAPSSSKTVAQVKLRRLVHAHGVDEVSRMTRGIVAPSTLLAYRLGTRVEPKLHAIVAMERLGITLHDWIDRFEGEDSTSSTPVEPVRDTR